MIPDNQVLEIITERLPDVCFTKNDLKTEELYKHFELLTDHAMRLVEIEDNDRLKEITTLLHQISGHCGNRVMTAIENIFLYRIGTKITLSENREQLLDVLPASFRQSIIQQVMASNI